MIEDSIVVTRGRNSPEYIKGALRHSRGLQLYDSALEPTLALEKGLLNPLQFKSVLVEAPRREGLQWSLEFFLEKVTQRIPTTVSITAGIAHSTTPSEKTGEGWEALARRLEKRGDVIVIIGEKQSSADDFLRAWEQSKKVSLGTTLHVHRSPLTEVVSCSVPVPWLSTFFTPHF